MRRAPAVAPVSQEPFLARCKPALRAGGAAACILNAANEEAVALFLQEKIRFGDIYRIVDETMQCLGVQSADTLDAVIWADREARRIARMYSLQ